MRRALFYDDFSNARTPQNRDSQWSVEFGTCFLRSRRAVIRVYDEAGNVISKRTSKREISRSGESCSRQHWRKTNRGVICAMKPRHSFVSEVLLILAFLCAISISTVAQGSPPPGRLIVKRVPNFGWNLTFHLQIDGRSVANVVQGRRYDGWVPAGRHVLTVYKVPYVGYAEPTSRTVNVQPGRTYVFTAMWDSNLIFLRRSEVLSPGELWQLRP